VQEPDAGEHGVEMRFECRHLPHRGRRLRGRPRRRAPHREADLVADDLHRLREVQRLVTGIGRNPDEGVAAREVLVHEAVALAAEQHRHRAARRGGDEFCRRHARIQHAEVRGARPRARAEHEPAVGDGGRHRRLDARRAQELRAAGGAREGLRIRRRLWPHQHERVEPHVAHRARARAQVARMAGIGEHDSDCGGHEASRRMAAILLRERACTPWSTSRPPPRAAPAS
jgi:hypothetical protein